MSNELKANEPNALKFLLDSPIYLLKSEYVAQTEPNINLKDQELTHRPTYKGGFVKKIMVVLSSESGVSNADELDLFNKTISALKLSIEDVALFEISKNDSSLNLLETLELLKPEKLVTFGEIPNLSITKLHSTLTVNSVPTLHCSSLKTLSQKQDIKIEWWNAIKNFLA